MCSFGGPDAEYLKKALDSIFLVENKDTGVKEGNVPLDDYETKLASATADVANVNIGIYTDALTR